MTHAPRTGWPLVAGLAFGGCADGSPATFTVADSAGVEIVTNLPGSIELAETWALALEPAVEIGAGASPEVALFRVTDVAALEGGRVAVGTNAPPRALVFDADGSLAATLGREGEGPGEFASVGSVVPLPGDSLAVWDPDRRRISIFTREGRFAREVDLGDLAPVSTRAAPGMDMASGITHLLPAGSRSLVLFAEGMVDPDPEPGTGRPELPAYRITTEGEEIAAYGSFPGMEWVHGGPAGALPLPFGARTYAATVDDALVVGTAEVSELRVFGPAGALVRIVRWPERDRTVGAPYLQTWSGMVESAPPPVRDIAESLPRRQTYPAYEGLVGTEAGEILVGDYPGPVGIWPIRRADEGPEAFQPELRLPSRRWLVFDRGGALVATLSTPEGFEPYAVRDGLVWGVYVDEVDVESVRAYEIARAGGSGR